jgi:hypothetical protein
MEKLGVHKRDIMVDRVVAARDAQTEAKEQFLTAMEQFRGVVAFQGGDLEREYHKLDATLQESESRATAVRERIGAVEDLSEALFSVWETELGSTPATAAPGHQRKYDATKRKTHARCGHEAGRGTAEPVLVPLRCCS